MSAILFNGQPMTKREVLIAREYYENGIVRGIGEAREKYVGVTLEGIRTEVARRIPLPTVTRRRSVTLDNGLVVTIKPDTVNTIGGGFTATRDGETVIYFGNILALSEYIRTLDDVRLIADLLANPTEEVEE